MLPIMYSYKYHTYRRRNFQVKLINNYFKGSHPLKNLNSTKFCFQHTKMADGTRKLSGKYLHSLLPHLQKHLGSYCDKSCNKTQSTVAEVLWYTSLLFAELLHSIHKHLWSNTVSICFTLQSYVRSNHYSTLYFKHLCLSQSD